MFKKQRWQARILSFLLAFIMVLQDGAAMTVRADEKSTETVKSVQEDTDTAGEDSGKKDADTAGEDDEKGTDTNTDAGPEGADQDTDADKEGADTETDSGSDKEETGTETDGAEETDADADVSGNDVPEDVSGNDPVLREPENYYPEGDEEDYGELVAYDAYSRTYLTGEAPAAAGAETEEEGKASYVTVIGPSASYYIDEEGELQETDNTLSTGAMARYALGSVRYENGSGAMQVSLPEELSDQEGIYIDASGHTLELVPEEGDFTRSMAEDNAIRYSDVFPGVDYQYTVLGDSLKEDIVLLEKNDKNTFSYLLYTDGLEAELSENQVILYEDNKEEPAYFLEAPEMVDAAGDVSFAVKLSLEETEEDTYRISVEADKEWLSDESRAYPVRIDPTAVNVGPSAFSLACAEEGSPRSVIGDNQYPYVGYDDGVVSGNYKGFGSRHLNCRTYMMINYDFSALMAEAEITSAGLSVTQKTGWSKGNSQFGLYQVTDAWTPGRLTWNSQLSLGRSFVDAKPSVSRGQSIIYDVTDAVSGWINGWTPNYGFVMKAETEKSGSSDAGKMQCEVFYNRSSASYGPKLVVSWTGALVDLANLDINDLTVDVEPILADSIFGGSTTLSVLANGLSQAESEVTYTLVEGGSGKTVPAASALLYPDSDLYRAEYPLARENKKKRSNWQGDTGELQTDVIYHVEATAKGKDLLTGAPAESDVKTSDTFLIYEEKLIDVLPRIADHYGVDINTILKDNDMPDMLCVQGERIFIRNPQTAEPYSNLEIDYNLQALIDGLLRGRALHCMYGFEPVNLNTGSFYMTQEDASLTDIGGTFSLERNYSSVGAYYGNMFGMGWASPYSENLSFLEDGRVLYFAADGMVLPFEGGTAAFVSERSAGEENGQEGDTEDSAGTDADEPEGETGDWKAPEGYDYTLEQTEDGWLVTDPSGVTHGFDVFGLLKTITDIHGNVTELVYDTDFYLCAIVTPSGKTFSVRMDEDQRIEEITLPDGNKVTYTYDDNDDLVKVTYGDGTYRSYQYDSNHHMTSWQDENGTTVVENAYDEKGRVTSQKDANGNLAKLSYSGNTTTTTDNNGNVTVYTYDDMMRTTKVEYPDGRTERFAYDGRGFLSEKTDEAGNTTRYENDAKGRVVKETRADGAARTFSYDSAGQILTESNFSGNVTAYTYDAHENPVKVTDGSGRSVTCTYDEINRRTSLTDGNGNTTTYHYQGTEAVPASVTDGDGHSTAYAYDAMNRTLSETDALGHVKRYTYNKRGWNISETDGEGGKEIYTFDQAGNVTAITDKNGNTAVFTYDSAYNLINGKDALGNTLTYTYDGNYNILTETDAQGNTTTYEYDSRDRLVKETDAMGNVQSYEYDAKGNLTGYTDKRGSKTQYAFDTVLDKALTRTDAKGNATAYRYDKDGRVAGVTYADHTTVSYAYDGAGRLSSQTDQKGLVTTLSYDGAGNLSALWDDESRKYTYSYNGRNLLTGETDPLGYTFSYGYDGAGNLSAATDQNGNTTVYGYDKADRLITILDALEGKTSYTYDKNGNLLTVTDPEGAVTTYEYDAIGELTKAVDALGGETKFVYDSLGQITQMTDAGQGLTTYRYNALGQLTSSTDVLGRTTEQAFDAAGNLLKVTCPNGDEEYFRYDSLGRLVCSRDRAGLTTYYLYDAMGRVVKAFDNADNEMAYAYDERGSLTEQKDTIGRTAAYEYDMFGRIVKSTGIDTAVTSYSYNARNDLVGILDAEEKSTTYEYDGAGNLVKTTEPGDAVYQYVYDKLNRLAKKVNPLGAETLYAYNKDSSLTEKTDGNGVVTGYVYDALQRPVAYRDGNGGETSYLYDAMDRVLSITTPEGNKESYTYDKAGRMRSVTDPNGLTTSYSYDLMDNLVKEVSPLEAETSYTYDKHDIVTGKTDAKGNTTAYEVDLNGLVKSLTNPDGGVYAYSYDKVHRLTGITTPLGLEKTFTYDTRGNIVKSADNLGRKESYSYDIMHRVLTAENALGGVGTYTYDIRGNLSGYTDALGYTTQYAWNLIDDLVSATDPEGKIMAVGYDKEGHITSVGRPGERITGYAYDNNYNLTGITDPKGYLYERSYDKDDRLIGTKNPLSETEKYVYDAGSRLTAFTDRMKLTEHYTWGNHNNLTSKTATGGEKTNYGYDILGNLIYVQAPMGEKTKYTYDSMRNLTSVTDAMGRKTVYTYDLEQNLTSITDASGRTEKLTYDTGSRRTSYTMNGGNSIRYDYDALNDLVEKTYRDENGDVQESIGNTVSEGNPSGVLYGYDLLGQRTSMMDTSGDSVYTYDGLGRITSVTTYRKPAEAGADTADKEDGETIRYEYDGCDQLAAIVYADGTRVSYAYDKNDNLTAVTDRNGKTTTYVYDAINRVTEIHRPNGISTYNTYNARDQIVSLKNTCDECGWVVSQYDYTYDDNGYIATEKAVESLYDYAWDDKHNGHHEDGRHDDKMPHGTKHNGKHDKDSEYHFQLVETDREFTYDENGRLLSSKEQEENSGLTTYDYTYDKVGNRLSYVKRTQTTKHPNKTDIAESAFYQYNDSNQLVSAKLFDGKKDTTVDYTYDDNGNLISEIGEYGTDKVETYYDYTVENRLQAVYDADRLLMAAAYDGDGNRVFQLNYNLHTDEDWKDNSGNGNGNNKDNTGSGNNGNGNSSSGNNGNNGNSGNNGNGNGNSGNNGNGNNKENSKSEGTDDAGYGNATNAEEHNSQNQSGILFPVAEEISRTETDLIAMIKTTGKDKDYELIEYILNVNTQYTQVLMELNENGAMDAVYTYGVSRLTEDRFTGESNFYLYDPAGNVAGITDQDGYLWQSYRYDAFGNATFGSPQYDNEYTFNAESYNPNIQSQYLRARYYDMVKGNFLTEDSYLGDIRNPLTLNRYSYCIGNPLFYDDPSGHRPSPYDEIDFEARNKGMLDTLQGHQNRVESVKDNIYNWLGESSELYNEAPADQALNGFISAFGASFYATYDKVTHPEYFIALGYQVGTHPVETLKGMLWSGSIPKGYYNYKNGNYRAVGEDAGYLAGNLTQVALARAAVKKCGDLLDNRKGKTSRPSPSINGNGNKLPQGISEEAFDKGSQLIRDRVGDMSDDIVVHGSRASGTAKQTSDIDIAIKVTPEKFDELIKERFNSPNPGSAKERTMLHAIETGKIQAGEAGLRGLRKELEEIFGMDVDISIIEEGGAFDNPPFISINN